MFYRRLHVVSWLSGIFGLTFVIWYFQPADFYGAFRSVGFGGALAWLVLTLLARILLVEITVIPIHVLGFPMRRSDAFWIGWVRTFTNQILPLSGLAYYARQIQRSAGISWSELVALSTPQFFLAASGLGLIGIFATAFNIAQMGQAVVPMMFAFVLVTCGSVFAATKSAWLIESLPKKLAARLERSGVSFGKLAQHPHLIFKLILFHCGAILLRGARIWILFAATGTQLDWQQALLILAIAESAMLFQITPGGLGLREGAIVGAAALLHISPDVGAGVALLDRLFVVGITTLLVTPAFVLAGWSKKEG